MLWIYYILLLNLTAPLFFTKLALLLLLGMLYINMYVALLHQDTPLPWPCFDRADRTLLKKKPTSVTKNNLPKNYFFPCYLTASSIVLPNLRCFCCWVCCIPTCMFHTNMYVVCCVIPPGRTRLAAQFDAP